MHWRQRTPKDEFLVLGCDGLFEVLTPQQVVDFVHESMKQTLKTTEMKKKMKMKEEEENENEENGSRHRSCPVTAAAAATAAKDICVALVSHAIAQGSRDNVTMVLVIFDENRSW